MTTYTPGLASWISVATPFIEAMLPSCQLTNTNRLTPMSISSRADVGEEGLEGRAPQIDRARVSRVDRGDAVRAERHVQRIETVGHIAGNQLGGDRVGAVREVRTVLFDAAERDDRCLGLGDPLRGLWAGEVEDRRGSWVSPPERRAD